MHWEVLIIPLIAFGVWLLGNLFKAADESDKTRPRRGEGKGPAELDRFLAQARRQREREGEARRPEPVREAPRRPSERRPPQPVARKAQPAPAPAPRSSVAQAPARAPVMMELVEEARPVALAMPVETQPTGPLAQAPAPAVLTASRRGASPLLLQVAIQLRSPQSAAAAFVLREIFDRPLSQRRPRR